jgi:hypothetical protein
MKLYNLITESKKTEELGLNLLKKNGIEYPEDIISQFSKGDKSQNQKNIPFMSLMYILYEKNIDLLISVFNEYNELEIKKRIKPIQLKKGLIYIEDTKINDFVNFTNIIHSVQSKYSNNSKGKSYKKDNESIEPVDKPMWSGNGFDIYDSNNIEKCIKYRNGGLTGKHYSFCIGAHGPSNAYNSYRDTNISSFYFIVDKNRIITNEDGTINLDDPLHLVVFNARKDGISLTDANNFTDNISQYGKNIDGYINYLKLNGVPLEIMKNMPKTKKEIEDDKILGKSNKDLSWFINLPMEYKSRYIGRGHILSDEQFDYLLGEIF